MSNAKDIAEHGTAFCAAALPFLTASAVVSGIAAVAVPAATLTAIGYTIWKSSGRRACKRAWDAALAQLTASRDFAPEDLDRAALLLKEAPLPVDLSPSGLLGAAATADFNRALARRLVDALAEPADYALRNILMPVFEAAVAVCRLDPDFHRDLTQDLLIDAARQNGQQLRLLERIDHRTAATHRVVESFGERLEDIASQSRDTLEAIALRFGVDAPEDMAPGELRGFLIEKAKDYRRVVVQVQKLQDREGRIANLKAAAEDAIRALRLDEAKHLIRDAIAVQRTERTFAALRDDAALVETEAEIALLEGDADEAFRLLAASADSFASFDRLEAVLRRGPYMQALLRHGRRYGGTGLDRAIELGQTNIEVLDEADDAELWSICQNDIGLSFQVLGERKGGEAGAALLANAVETFRAVLRVQTEAEHPVSWAMTKSNLGIALAKQGSLTGGSEGSALVAEAVKAYRAALRVRSKTDHPVDWAGTQINLGNALSGQAECCGDGHGAELLSGAVEAYCAALSVLNEEEHPFEWAAAQNNLGLTHKKLSEQKEGTAAVAV